jgi:hypothetical protein
MRTLETDLLRLVDGEHVLVLGVEAPSGAGVLRHLIVESDLSAYGLVNVVTHFSVRRRGLTIGRRSSRRGAGS